MKRRGRIRPGRVLELKNGTTIELTGSGHFDDYNPTGQAEAAVLRLDGLSKVIRWCDECRTNRACKHVPN